MADDEGEASKRRSRGAVRVGGAFSASGVFKMWCLIVSLKGAVGILEGVVGVAPALFQNVGVAPALLQVGVALALFQSVGVALALLQIAGCAPS